MLKNKKIIIILSIIFVVIISISIWIFRFIKDYNNSKTIQIENQETIKKSYEILEKNINSFSDVREEVYTIILNEIYYEELEKNNKQFEEILSKYNKIVIRIKNDSKELGNLCINKLYHDVTTNNRCKKFIDTYETIVNMYVNDINIYNDYIEKYNEWILENNKELKSVSYYESKEITKSIDYNKDGKYSGTEE